MRKQSRLGWRWELFVVLAVLIMVVSLFTGYWPVGFVVVLGMIVAVCWKGYQVSKSPR